MLRPDRVGSGQLHFDARGRHPAEFGIERMRAAGRREQHDRRRFRIDGLAIFDEREIVDAAALERDRSARRVGVSIAMRGEAAITAWRGELRPGAGAEIWPGACGPVGCACGCAGRTRLRGRARRCGSGDRARCSQALASGSAAGAAARPASASPSAACRRNIASRSARCGQANGEDRVFLVVHRVLLMAMRAADGAIEILFDAFERQGQSGAAPDQHIVMSGANALRAGAAGRFPAGGGARDCVRPHCRPFSRR